MAAAACAVALAGGCGSGALSGPGGDESPASGAAGSGGATNGAEGKGGKGGHGGGEEYSWGLPEGPTAVDPPASVYAGLQKGDCGQAESTLNGFVHARQIEPGDEPLFRAGIDLCRGNVAGAREHLAAFHWPGSSGGWATCHLYRAAASVVHQRAGSSFVAVCPPIPPLRPKESVEPPPPGSPGVPPPPGLSGAPSARSDEGGT